MNRIILSLAIGLFLLAGCNAPKEVAGDDRSLDFTADWAFHLGDDTAASRPDYNDADWRKLNLPHDWAIEGEFSKDNPSGTGGGALPGGIGWYRKTFTADKADEGKCYRIDFDGVYMNSTVYINGHELGTRPYGYISFSYDLTPYIRWGEENVLAVRVDNAEQPNSRWYSGCGIYRNVWLTKLNPVHVAQWGTYVTAEEVSKNSARLKIRTSLQYDVETQTEDSVQQADGTYVVFDSEIIPLIDVVLQSRLVDADGNVVGEAVSEAQLMPVAPAEMEQEIELKNPNLWSIDAPYIYKVESILKNKETGEVLDRYYTPTGIRTFRFDAQKGFVLNGEQVKINGVCMHHDLGCLGAAVNTRAIERQLEILKEMGCNGIRCSHNPPAPELLDLCDRMGFIVMDETFDMWRKKKTRHDYSRYFNEWHERDLTDLIVRDRNHPSIFMWSIGNEILEQWDDLSEEFGDLPIEQQNMLLNFLGRDSSSADDAEVNQNVLMTRHLVSTLKEIDATRPVTAGCNETRPMNNLLRSGALDIVGFNYHEQDYDSVRVWYPGVPFIGSETASALNSRGFYLNPSSELHVMPERWDLPYDTAHHQCSAYDHCRAPWATLHETAWIAVRDRDYAAGTFVWTGFDYLGEPTPYSWPSRSSYFGIVDLCGFPKDCYYMYRSEWTDEPTLHLFPHWNWSEGDKVDVWAYYNTADEVGLLVNGRSLGRSAKTPERLHALWEGVRFGPGEITAVAYKDGEEIMRQTRRTAGEAVGLTLTPDRERIAADGYDLSFVTIDAVDADGCFMPTAMNALRITVGGAGELVGVDNGDATSHDSLKGGRIRLFNGKALAIVRSIKGVEGEIVLRVEGDGLQSSAVTVTSI